MNTIIQLPGLTIDISALRSVFAPSGLPQWSGKIVLTFDDSIDGTTTVVTANWSGEEESCKGMLVDFEGDIDEVEMRGMLPVFNACEVFALTWSKEISNRIGRPSAFEAHANDLSDPTFAARHEPKAA